MQEDGDSTHSPRVTGAVLHPTPQWPSGRRDATTPRWTSFPLPTPTPSRPADPAAAARRLRHAARRQCPDSGRGAASADGGAGAIFPLQGVPALPQTATVCDITCFAAAPQSPSHFCAGEGERVTD